MRSDADTVERYLAELRADRRPAIEAVRQEVVARTSVDDFIAVYEPSRER